MDQVISSLLPTIEPFKAIVKPKNYSRYDSGLTCPPGTIRTTIAKPSGNEYLQPNDFAGESGSSCPKVYPSDKLGPIIVTSNIRSRGRWTRCACETDSIPGRRALDDLQAKEDARIQAEKDAAIEAAKEKVKEAEAKAKAASILSGEKKKAHDTAIDKVNAQQQVYDGVQRALNNENAIKAAYADALLQQKTANTLLTTATSGFDATKTKVTTAFEQAKAASDAALATFTLKDAQYAKARNTVLSLKTVYDNAQMVLDNAKAKKAAYDDALAQQKTANELLTNAATTLSRSNVKIQGDLNKPYAEQAELIKNATVFPNTTFGIHKQYNTMSINWTAYNAAKEELSKIDANNVVDSTTATNKLVETYNKFIASKEAYTSAVIPALQSSTTDIDYIRNNNAIVDTYNLRDKQYSTMIDAWAKVTKSISVSDIAGTLANYNAYLVAKTAYSTALLVAEGKRAEAEFQMKLAAGKEAAERWAKSGTNGCRRIQTVATTDENMLDQNIVCSDTEYISGYSKVSGYNAAPVDPNVSRDNIGQYLAVKYACCTAPTPPKGEQGKKGLPGLDGATGQMGQAGVDGIVGPVGAKGESGETGEEGGKGPRGDAGDDGINGEAGPPGKAGTSVKVPYIRQVPGPTGRTGQQGRQGPKGPKGPDGVIKPAPVQPFSELDRTIALLDIEDKINKYMNN